MEVDSATVADLAEVDSAAEMKRIPIQRPLRVRIHKEPVPQSR